VKSARLAQSAGYDGVEIMGSEGYLINQFLVEETNIRTDEWGGSYTNRMKFPVEIVRQIREACGQDFLVMYRLSMLDLVPKGSSWKEVVQLAQAIEKAGANVINTGIGWHEARIPTIATSVPRGQFSFVTKKLKGHVEIPLVATNRFNNPETCETALRDGVSDLISMARPFLADPEIMNKSAASLAHEINTCIGCNQACLDHIFKRKVASCLVNPRASHEGKWPLEAKAIEPLHVAIVGSGPAGLSAAIECARLGHDVEIFEGESEIGGQFNLAKQIPGKEEFFETLRYFEAMIKKLGVKVHLNRFVSAQQLSSQFNAVILASGVRPRSFKLLGMEGGNAFVGYTDVLKKEVLVGDRVAIIGAGGIGFDVADFLSHDNSRDFSEIWGIDEGMDTRGGLSTPEPAQSKRQIHLFQRSKGKVGGGLGKTTGWIHRKALKNRGVTTHSDVSYQKWEHGNLFFVEGGVPKSLAVDHVVICAGQESRNDLLEDLQKEGVTTQVIGGAKNARALDAQRAIREGLESAYSLADWTVSPEN
jgi:2,4-dienoyl-CoA reductase (NADPH2)